LVGLVQGAVSIHPLLTRGRNTFKCLYWPLTFLLKNIVVDLQKHAGPSTNYVFVTYHSLDPMPNKTRKGVEPIIRNSVRPL